MLRLMLSNNQFWDIIAKKPTCDMQLSKQFHNSLMLCVKTPEKNGILPICIYHVEKSQIILLGEADPKTAQNKLFFWYYH